MCAPALTLWVSLALAAPLSYLVHREARRLLKYHHDGVSERLQCSLHPGAQNATPVHTLQRKTVLLRPKYHPEGYGDL